ncbi:dynein regulatory complex protein 8 isoform X1 [Zeugodacus cucurbitae]|uniref:EF-hand calcium-binding domain-containing protein 2 n=1 Tax=Zeugodacus cucurbitae TaxID=28588 RepID=A0A0A1WJ41_ZEUCU|nr:dynein regulatory complex protein 8 isoform X1 [Zeugodacus cucurbitae]
MEVAIPINNELEQRISDAFCIFDHHGDKRIDIREVGTVLRFLGCVPTEQEINEVIAATEMEESAGDVHLSKFMPYVAQLLAERKMEPASPEKILAAFQVLDPEQKTYITKEYMSKVMMEEGEPFTQEELDEMLAVAIDPITGNIPYEFYINQLMHAPDYSIYELAAKYCTMRPKEAKRGSKWTGSRISLR